MPEPFKFVERVGRLPIIASAATDRQVQVEAIEGTDGALSIVRNVELCAVGIEYPLASGPATFTPEDLLQAVASQDDPAIQSPRVWLGHPDDQRFHAGRTTPAGSAEPALGKVLALRVEDEGMTLVGDIHGCPTWLANILASAYPNRSVEGFRYAETVTGHKWSLVITDLALLGVCWPGVTTLSDLEALYSEEGPPNIEVEEAEPMAVAAARGRSQVQGQAELEKVRRAFVAQVADLEIPGWPWIRAVLQDPNELIVDDDEGGLYRIPYDASSDEVTFGEVEAVKVQYVNASQAKDPDARGLLVNMLTRDLKVVASWDQRAASRPDTTNQEDLGMKPEQIQLLRARLGLTEEQLPDDATEEQINAALEPPSADPPSGGTTQPGTAGAAGAEVPSPEQLPDPNDDIANLGTGNPGPGPVEGQLPPGMIAVPAEQWTAMQSSMQTVTADHAHRRQESDFRTIEDAIKAGKIPPAQRQYYQDKVKDPLTRDSHINLLTAAVDKGGLMPGLIPVEARGADLADSDLTTEAYPAGWLPELAENADTQSRVTQEA